MVEKEDECDMRCKGLHENEPVRGKHFHNNRFASRLVLAQVQKAPRDWPIKRNPAEWFSRNKDPPSYRPPTRKFILQRDKLTNVGSFFKNPNSCLSVFQNV